MNQWNESYDEQRARGVLTTGEFSEWCRLRTVQNPKRHERDRLRALTKKGRRCRGARK